MQEISVTSLRSYGYCSQQYKYNYIDKLSAKNTSEALHFVFGSLGHSILADYHSNENFVLQKSLEKNLETYPLQGSEVATMRVIIEHYMATYPRPSIILNDDQRFSYTFKDLDVTLTGRPDRLEGTLLYDVKFLKNFMPEVAVGADFQLLAYAFLLVQNGYPVTSIILDQILKEFPGFPKLNNDGVTLNKRNRTTYNLAYSFAEKMGIVEHNKNYLEELKHQPNKYFRRIGRVVHPSLFVENGPVYKMIEQRLKSFLTGSIYPNYNFLCNKLCEFHELCCAENSGQDTTVLKKVMYNQL